MSFFDDFSSIDTGRWGTSVGGGGSVTSSDSRAIIDPGGSADADAAILYLKATIDITKSQVIAVCMKESGAVPGADVPAMMSLLDKSTAPAVTTESNWTAQRRMWFENQSSATESSERVQFKLRDTGGTVLTWRKTAKDWSTSFQHSHSNFKYSHNYHVWVFYIDGDNNRVRMLGFVQGKASVSPHCGLMLFTDTGWRTWGTDVDGVDNDLYLVFGDGRTDNGAAIDVIDTIEWVAVMDDVRGDAGYAYTNDADDVAFPFPYHITVLRNFDPSFPMWVPAQPYDVSGMIGTADMPGGKTWLWVKDAFVFKDGSTYYLFVSAREDLATDLSHILVASSTSPDSGWGTFTEILTAPGSGLLHYQFPWVTKDSGGRWHLFFSVERDDEAVTPSFDIRYAWTDSSAPTSGWSSPVVKLSRSTTSGDPDFYGVAQPFIYKLSDSEFQLWYAQYDNVSSADTWTIDVATSSTIDGTYAKFGAAGDIIIDVGGVSTQINRGGGESDVNWTVDSTTGFANGDLIACRLPNDSAFNRVRKVTDSTHLEVYHGMDIANNAEVIRIDGHSVSMRHVHDNPDTGTGGLELIATVFKYGKGEEVVARYLGTSSADPKLATWTLDNTWGPLAMLPNLAADDRYVSAENFAYINSAFPVSGGVANPWFQYNQQLAGGL